MDLASALRMVKEGKKIKRPHWADGEYAAMNNGRLHLKLKDGFHIWEISEEDLSASDWESISTTPLPPTIS